MNKITEDWNIPSAKKMNQTKHTELPSIASINAYEKDQAEIERLRAINHQLLEACKEALRCLNEYELEYPEKERADFTFLKDAIKNAENQAEGIKEGK